MIAKTLFAAAALVATAAATPAAAEQFEFRYKSYEIETQGGRGGLMARLDRSIDRFCNNTGVRGISAKRAASACAEAVKVEVMAKIDNVEFANLDR